MWLVENNSKNNQPTTDPCLTGTSFLRTSVVQRVEEIRIKTLNLGFCFKMLGWFDIQVVNLVWLADDNED